jgi:Flp pilus assembly pilin Flp
MADYASMGEYGIVVSTVAAVLIAAFAGIGRTLPATTAEAGRTIARVAKASEVSVADARQALARAPSKRAQLKTLYALGWIAGMKDRATCLIATATGGSTVDASRAALRKLPDHAGLLRRSHVSEAAAVNAIDRGFRSSCPV